MSNSHNTITLKISNHKTKIYLVLRVIVALSLLIYLISFVELDNIVSTFLSSDILLLSLSVLLLLPNIYLQYWKWKLTCEKLIGAKSRRKVLMSLFYGFPAAVFTPARAGEYFGRGLAFKEFHFSEIVLATLVDKLFTILVTFILGSMGMILFISYYYESSVHIPMPLMITFLVLTILAVAFIFSDLEWLYKFISPVLKFKFFAKIGERLMILRNLDRSFVLKMMFISSLFFICYLIQFTILLASFSHHFDFSKFFLAALVIMFSKTILSPISFSELGIREGASIFFLTQMGESASTALNASLTLFAINILLPSLVGMILLFVKSDD